jgi:hypothetical protein
LFSRELRKPLQGLQWTNIESLLLKRESFWTSRGKTATKTMATYTWKLTAWTSPRQIFHLGQIVQKTSTKICLCKCTLPRFDKATVVRVTYTSIRVSLRMIRRVHAQLCISQYWRWVSSSFSLMGTNVWTMEIISRLLPRISLLIFLIRLYL